jgi:probable rRNA maturation factor
MTRRGPSGKPSAQAGASFGQKARGSAKAVPAGRRPLSARYAIHVSDEQNHLTVPAARIRRIARVVLAVEKVTGATISVALVDNGTIHRLNRDHLNHDEATDVLSFLFESKPSVRAERTGTKLPRGKGCRIDGEVVMSAEMALQTAPRFGWAAPDELTLYLVHGLLHLCGYDDLTDAERPLMRTREREILSLLGISPVENAKRPSRR